MIFGRSARSRKVFCISMQRTGTTSVGKFFRDFGLRWVGWPGDKRNNWSRAWYDGDLEAIFGSKEFTQGEAFEDSPWWLPGFFKVLHHRCPGSRFILLTRDPDDWFKSMAAGSQGQTIGNTRMHCKIYRREADFFWLLDNLPGFRPSDTAIDNLMPLWDRPTHYKAIYELHNREVRDFFQQRSPDSLFSCRLEDADKWQRLGRFLGLEVPEGYEAHENKSEQP
jgi:hypothetical protein